ncbi:MAG: UbiD family decarboxylase [Chloroflexi bacterium]|nr:UbiD family decarboxylase [Chloroflexota bacterium]
MSEPFPTLRSFLADAEAAGHLITIRRSVSPHLEMARVILALDGRPVLFTDVPGYAYRVAAGICSDRRYFAMALGCRPEEVSFRLADALSSPRRPPVLQDAPCQEVVEEDVDLERIPFLTHWEGDAGPYATAAVAIVNDPDTGPNASYHRLLRLDRRRLVARIIEQRGTDTALRKAEGDLPVAICIGLPPHILLAAAMSPPPEVDEMHIAQALAPTPLVACRTVPLHVPAAAEIVLEGRITRQTAAEGPFMDLTGTWDIVRQQPVIEIDCITHRRDPIYQALLPGRLEHRLLMGMPREPTIFAAVNQVCQCLNVYVTPGGASWLHAVVQIRKRHPEDGRRAAEAAFRGHGSLKHVWVVDEDVDLFDPNDVEWAMATRFQADRDLLIWRDQPSSSLDPSATHVPGEKSRSAKMGLDCTIPWDSPQGPSDPAAFQRVPIPHVDLTPYLEEQGGAKPSRERG